MSLIDGKQIAEGILRQIKLKVLDIHPKPKLAIVLASNDESSKKYIELKSKAAEKVGVDTKIYYYPEEITLDQLIFEIKRFRSNEAINGVLIQLPFYKHLEPYENLIINSLDHFKDSDGLTAIQQGSVSHFLPGSILPAAVEAVLECLNICTKEDLSWDNLVKNHDKITFFNGKNVLIINNTNLIGKPLSNILCSMNATVNIANEVTHDLKTLSLAADIIVSATGKTDLIDYKMIKKDAILIDVTSTVVNGKAKGDFIMSKELVQKASFVTPVPGGIGPITIACLLRNLLK